MNNFIEIIKMSQEVLHKVLKDILKDYGYTVMENKNKWLYGFMQEEPVLLTAHLDTVFKEQVKDVVVEKHDGLTILSSPQGIGGDDRCGVWMILKALEDGYRPAILFCHEEEKGGIGSNDLCNNTPKKIKKDIDKLKYMIEIDRANRNDCVFYDCDNPEFTTYIQSFGFVETWGTFSDISHLAPHFKKAAVNISTGDYKQHQLDEYVIFEEMLENYQRLTEMLDDAKEAEEYEYIEAVRSYRYYGSYGNRYNDWSYYDPEVCIEIEFIEHGNIQSEILYGASEEEAFGRFLLEHPSVCIDDIMINDIVYDDYYSYYK